MCHSVPHKGRVCQTGVEFEGGDGYGSHGVGIEGEGRVGRWSPKVIRGRAQNHRICRDINHQDFLLKNKCHFAFKL